MSIREDEISPLSWAGIIVVIPVKQLKLTQQVGRIRLLCIDSGGRWQSHLD